MDIRKNQLTRVMTSIVEIIFLENVWEICFPCTIEKSYLSLVKRVTVIDIYSIILYFNLKQLYPLLFYVRILDKQN